MYRILDLDASFTSIVYFLTESEILWEENEVQ